MRNGKVLMPRKNRKASCGARLPPTWPNPVLRTGATRASAPATMPPVASPWPPRYLVMECITRSMPHSSGRTRHGVQKVLSATVVIPRARAMAATSARSCRRRVGLVSVSTQTMRVAGVRLASSPVAVASTTRMPQRSPRLRSRPSVPPYSGPRNTSSSPGRSRPSTSDAVAAVPLAKATAACAPSRSASLASSAATVGLAKRL